MPGKMSGLLWITRPAAIMKVETLFVEENSLPKHPRAFTALGDSAWHTFEQKKPFAVRKVDPAWTAQFRVLWQKVQCAPTSNSKYLRRTTRLNPNQCMCACVRVCVCV